VDRDSYNELQTSDGVLILHLVPQTLPAQLAFIAVVDTHAPVAVPEGWVAVSHAYSIQASGSVGNAERAYLFTLRYDPDQLDPTVPEGKHLSSIGTTRPITVGLYKRAKWIRSGMK
jgi:hypothetical protein